MGLRYALIGCGRIAVKHYEAAIQSGLDIVAICDVSDAILSQFAKGNNLSATVSRYTSYIDLLNGEELDIIAIATPSGSHYTIAACCIKHGVNVIIEKPITMCLEEADILIRLCQENKITATVCHQNRFNLSVKKVYEAIAEKKISKISHACAHVRWNRSTAYYEQSSWRGTWLNDGGAIMNQGIHNVDILRWVCGGQIEEVFAYIDNLQHPNIEVEDIALAVAKFSSGCYGTIEVTTNVYPCNLEETLYIFSDNGTIKLGGQSVNTIEHWDLQDETENATSIITKNSETPVDIYGNGHIALYSDFIDSIFMKKAPFISLKEGRDSLEFVLAIYKSSLTRQPVRFPIESDFSISNMTTFGGARQ